MTSSERAVRKILKECLAVKKNESIIILSEHNNHKIGEAFWQAIQKISKFSFWTQFLKKGNGSPLHASLMSSCLKCNIVIIISSQILQAESIQEVLRGGTRILGFQPAFYQQLQRTPATNFKMVAEKSRKLADVFKIGKKLRLISPSGTDAIFPIAKMKTHADTGLVHNASEFAWLPSGEADIFFKKAPVEGRVVLDGLLGRKKFSEKIQINFSRGHITQIKGGSEAEILRKNLRKFGREGRSIFKLGIGTNHQVRFGQSAHEDAKTYGLVHLGFGLGESWPIGVKLISPVKGYLSHSTIEIDGKVILKEGKIVI